MSVQIYCDDVDPQDYSKILGQKNDCVMVYLLIMILGLIFDIFM
jgi:hypothetical protein